MSEALPLPACDRAGRPRPRGRRPVATIPDEQDKHIGCAGRMILRNEPVKRIAQDLGISRRTAYRWYDLALGYDRPESAVLRRMANRN